MKIVNSNILVLSASSGVGKTTVVDRALQQQPSIHRCVTCTTRKPRKQLNEVDGKDYFFLTESHFKKYIKQNQFLEWSEHYGNYYGTLFRELERKLDATCIVLVVDPQGATKLHQILVKATFVCMLAPSFKIIRQRLEARQTDDPAEIAVRLGRYKKEVILMKKTSDIVLINAHLKDTVAEFLKIVEKISTKPGVETWNTDKH